jgi:hypothetical protein
MERVQSSAAEPGHRRRRMLPIVDVRFQWKYTLLITALGVGLTAVMGSFLYKAHLDNTNLLDLSENRLLQEQVVRGDRIFLLYLIALVIVMGLGLAFWGLVVTHRISGPLYIVARYLGVLADGQYPDMRPLRKHDELQDFFQAFEEAVNAMRNRDLDALRDLQQSLARIEALADKDKEQALNDACGVIERYRAILAETVGRVG